MGRGAWLHSATDGAPGPVAAQPLPAALVGGSGTGPPPAAPTPVVPAGSLPLCHHLETPLASTHPWTSLQGGLTLPESISGSQQWPTTSSTHPTLPPRACAYPHVLASSTTSGTAAAAAAAAVVAPGTVHPPMVMPHYPMVHPQAGVHPGVWLPPHYHTMYPMMPMPSGGLPGYHSPFTPPHEQGSNLPRAATAAGIESPMKERFVLL